MKKNEQHPEDQDHTSASVRMVRRIGPVRLAVTTVILLAVILVWALLINGRLSPQLVISSSMEPTVMKGDRLLIYHDLGERELHRGDIVMVDLMDRQLPLLKRLVALPGDYVVIVRNQVFVNEQPTTEQLAPLGLGRVRLSWYLEMNDDEYFVIGDNRGNSFDSVDIGPVSRDQITGIAVFRYMPLSEMGFIDRERLPAPPRQRVVEAGVP